MKKSVLLLSVVVVLSLFTGCTMTEDDYGRLTDRVTANSRDISSLVNEVNDLRAQSKLRNAEIERQLTDQSANTNQGLPELRLELDRMRAEVQRLTNVVEISQRRNTIGESEGKVLTAELNFIQLRLDRLEATLSLPPLRSAPAASAESPSTRPAAPFAEKPTSSVTSAEKKPSPEPEKVEVKPPPQPPTPEEEFQVAEALFKKELYDAAFTKFQDFIKEYPRSAMAPTAQFYAGECRYQQQRYEEAILEYQKVIKQYGRNQRVSNALLKQAFSFNYIGDKTSAKLLLQKLVREYPDTYSGKVAQERLSEMK